MEKQFCGVYEITTYQGPTIVDGLKKTIKHKVTAADGRVAYSMAWDFGKTLPGTLYQIKLVASAWN